MSDDAATTTSEHIAGADTVLEIDDLEVRYGNVAAVQGVSLSIAPGEVVGLIGPNGAGKSTTLAAVMGLVPAHGGDIRLRGTSLARVPTEQIARRGVALVPEGRHIYGAFTGAENMRLGLLGRSTGVGADDDVAWVEELFPVVREHSERRAGLLSGGQQQQLAIARALVSAPDVLLLDEPSLGLAPTIVATVFSALEQVRRRGVAILLVEQRAELTVEFADRAHVLREGRLVLTIGPDATADPQLLTEAYFGT